MKDTAVKPCRNVLCVRASQSWSSGGRALLVFHSNSLTGAILHLGCQVNAISYPGE